MFYLLLEHAGPVEGLQCRAAGSNSTAGMLFKNGFTRPLSCTVQLAVTTVCWRLLVRKSMRSACGGTCATCTDSSPDLPAKSY